MPFVTSLGVGAHLEAFGVAPERITELDWWESRTLLGGDSTFTATPSQHFSGRGARRSQHDAVVVVGDRRRERHRVFFSGDTGLTTEFDDDRRARSARSTS